VRTGIQDSARARLVPLLKILEDLSSILRVAPHVVQGPLHLVLVPGQPAHLLDRQCLGTAALSQLHVELRRRHQLKITSGSVLRQADSRLVLEPDILPGVEGAGREDSDDPVLYLPAVLGVHPEVPAPLQHLQEVVHVPLVNQPPLTAQYIRDRRGKYTRIARAHWILTQ